MKNPFRDSKPIQERIGKVGKIRPRLSGLTDTLTGRSSCTPAISYPAMAAICAARYGRASIIVFVTGYTPKPRSARSQ